MGGIKNKFLIGETVFVVSRENAMKSFSGVVAEISLGEEGGLLYRIEDPVSEELYSEWEIFSNIEDLKKHVESELEDAVEKARRRLRDFRLANGMAQPSEEGVWNEKETR